MKRKRITDFFKIKKYTIATSVCVALLIMCNLIFSALPSDFEAAEYTTETMSLLQDGAIVPVSDDFVSFDKQTQGVRTAGVTSAKSTQTAEQVIYNGLLNVSSSIDVSRFKLSSDDLTEILQNIINSSPELFYMESRWGWIDENDDSRVDTVKPYYNDTADNIAFKKIEYENEMNKILAGIDSEWSDLEKVVYVHDYLVQNYEYDTSYSIYDAYNFLTKGKGVCQSYTLVFCGIMQELGIDVSYASSDGMNHIWNVVKVNGNWYHVDNTWDDPVTDRLGLAAHENLLLSDTAIQQTSSPHYGWETSYTCTSTVYDNYYWKAIQSPFKYASGSWYYVSYDSADSGANLYKCSIDGQSEKVLSIGKWLVANTTSYYIEAFSGLYISGDNLFYNDLGKIYVYDLSSKTTQTL